MPPLLKHTTDTITDLILHGIDAKSEHVSTREFIRILRIIRDAIDEDGSKITKTIQEKYKLIQEKELSEQDPTIKNILIGNRWAFEYFLALLE